MNKKSLRIGGALFGAAALATGGVTAAATAAGPSHDRAVFPLVRSAASVKAGCLTNANAVVRIRNQGPVEVMTIDAHGLPRNTDFDVFINQLPNAPFGVSWYQGDLETNGAGNAHGVFVGRFSIETFTVAPGSGPPPLCTMDRSPTRRRTRNSLRCTSITSGCGSTRPRTRPRSPVPTSSRRSTGSTMRARRR